VPTYAPSGPALSYPLQPLQAKHKQSNLINNNEAYTALMSLLKQQTTKISLIKQEKKAITPKSQHTFIEVVP
jgi:hypothetical protein